MRGATTRRCSPPRARRSPRAGSPRRWRRSPAAPASASARSTATSPTARRCSRRSTSTRSRRSAARPPSSTARDPWEALNGWFERLIGYFATKRALAAELLNYLDHDAPLFQACRASLYAAGEPLLKRAQEAGVVRSDVEYRRGHADGRRDRARSRPAIPGRPSTSSGSRWTACATAPRRRRPSQEHSRFA